MRRSIALLAGLLTIGLYGTYRIQAQAQAAAAPLTAFEVVSLKPTARNNSGDAFLSTLLYLPGGKVRMLNSTVRMLLKTAYQFQDFQIVGGPGWINSDRYDLETSAIRDATREEYQIMLQAMLADRFRLKSHRENREGIEYELVVGRSGPKIKLSAEPGDFRGGRGRMTGKRTMPQLAQFLSRVIYSPVVDKTNLPGTYDIALEWTPDELLTAGDPPPASAPSIFTAVAEQLGLRLESHKGPFLDVLVIDSIAKPTEN